MAGVALSALGFVTSIPGSIDTVIELVRKSTVLSSNRLNALTGWENLCRDFSTLKANAKYFKETCSTAEEHLFRMHLNELHTKLCALKIELENVEKIAQRRGTRIFPSTLKKEVKAVAVHVQEVHGILRSICEKIADRRQRERNANEDFFIIGQNLAERPKGVEVLDFDTKDVNGARTTMEGRLLDAILALDGFKKITATSQGCGGVGKSCALRGIAHHPDIKDRFWGGILFVTLGQEAGEESLKDLISWMVQITGGKEKAKDVVAARTLERSVKVAGTWFSAYPCLFLFDDVWCGKTLGRAAINLLRCIACHQESRLVFTTRQAVFDSDVTVRFQYRPTESKVSRNILLSTSGFECEPECPSAHEAFHKLLRVARGSPLRLALIGGGVRKKTDLYNDINREEVWEMFDWGQAEDASIEEKDILLKSLSFLDEGDSERFYHRCFMSLCLLRYAQRMPMRVVSRLWGLSESEGLKIAEALAGVNIVRISKCRTDYNNCGEMLTVSLHDIMLDIARREAEEDSSDVCYAFQLINSYLKIPDGEESETVCSRLMMLCTEEKIELGINSEGHILTKSVSKDDGQIYQGAASSNVCKVACGGWRTINDGYFYRNFCWLMCCAKLIKELLWLISQPAWLIGQINKFGFALAEDDLRLTIKYTSGISKLDVSEDAIRNVKLLKSAVTLSKADAGFSSWRGLSWFQMYGRMLHFANQSESVRTYIQEVEQLAPRPWYKPSIGCLAPANDSIHTVLSVLDFLGCSLDGNDLIYWSFAFEARRDVEINKYSLSEECDKEKWVLKSAEVDDWINVIDCDVAAETRAMSSISLSYSASSRRKCGSHTEKNIERAFDRACPIRKSGNEVEISKMAVSRDSRSVVASMSDGSVRLWTLSNEKWYCKAFTGYSDKIWKVGISTDGTRFVSISSGDTIRLWLQREDGNWYSTTKRGPPKLFCFELSDDGNCVVVASFTGSRFIIYMLHLAEGGKPTKIEELSEIIRAVVTNTTGTCVSAVLVDGRVYVWMYDGENWRKTMLADERYRLFVGINGCGNCVVVASVGRVEVWQLEGETWHRKELKGDLDIDYSVAVNEAGTFVSVSNRKNIHVWKVPERMDNHPLEEHIVLEGDVSLEVSDTHIVGFHDRKVMLWKMKGKKWKRIGLEHSRHVYCIGTNGPKTCVACSLWDGSIQMWRLENGEWLNTFLKNKRERFSRVSCFDINEAGSCVVAGLSDELSSEYEVLILNLRDGEWQEAELTGHMDFVECLKVNEAGSFVVSGSQDTSVRLWEIKDGKWDGTIVGKHSDIVKGVAVNKSWTCIVSASYDKTVRVWVRKGDSWESTVLKCDWGKCHPEEVDISICENFILCKTFDSKVFAWRQVEEKWELTNSPNGVFSERWARQAACYRFPSLSRNEIIAAICYSGEGEVVYETRDAFFLTVPREPYLVRVDEIQ